MRFNMSLSGYHVLNIVLTFDLAQLKTGTISSKALIELNVASKCWVCEGWTRMDFRISKAEVEAAILQDEFNWTKGKVYVNLHMSYDGYRAHLLEEGFDNGASVFKTFRMVPPGAL